MLRSLSINNRKLLHSVRSLIHSIYSWLYNTRLCIFESQDNISSRLIQSLRLRQLSAVHAQVMSSKLSKLIKIHRFLEIYNTENISVHQLCKQIVASQVVLNQKYRVSSVPSPFKASFVSLLKSYLHAGLQQATD